jgi:Carboxypeptidase regulatory-like domain
MNAPAILLFLLAPFAKGNFTGPGCYGLIHGVVVDPQQRPASGLKVTLSPLGFDFDYVLPTTRTDSAGRYKFEQVCSGTYTVYPTDKAAGYPDVNPYVDSHLRGIEPVPGVVLTDEHLDGQFDIDLPPKPAILIVHAVNEDTGLEITEESVRITVPKKPKSNWVGAIGSKTTNPIVTIALPSDTELLVRVLCDGYHEWQDGRRRGRIVQLEPDSETTLEVRLKPIKY